MDSFVRSQQKTMQHRLAIWLIPIVVLAGYWNPYLFWIGLGIFFLVTSFQLLKSMLFWMLVLGGLSMLFPPLAPLIFIVMIIFFIMRIGFVIQNWRPFSYGILFYGFMAFLAWDINEYSGYVISLLLEIIYNFQIIQDVPWEFYEYMWVINGGVMAIVSTVFLRLMLKSCYKHGYESYVALGIMGSAPLIIISFLLPFLKIHIGDAIASDSYVSEKMPVATEKTFVDPYVRTAPDGILQNNYSYDGPDKLPPNPETTEVKGHWRSVPGEKIVHNDTSTVPVRSAEPALLPGKEQRRRYNKQSK